MGGNTIFRSNLSSPALLLSSGGARSANSLLKTSAQALFLASPATATVSSNRGGSSRLFSNGGRRALWIGARPTPAVGRVVTGADRPSKPGRAAGEPERSVKSDAAAAAGDTAGADMADAAARQQADGDPAPPPAAADAGPDANASPPAAEAADSTPPAAEPRVASRLELAIDSLPGYELIKPIPVIVEPLGNKVFVAEVPDLDISITGTSVSGVLLQLKDQIVRVYEGLRTKKGLDPERTRQLGKLETYIVKRRNWF
jgi:hypothetical protein